MNVYLTFDIEIWCNGWSSLDKDFLSSFDRYVYGRSKWGAFALPKTLEILRAHGLQGVFFVEPLFAARFGQPYLDEVVGLIRGAGQDVQLHIHPEWANEALEPLMPGGDVKRQNLDCYTLDEQIALIRIGKEMLRRAGVGAVSAFRAGNFAVNADTFQALAVNRIGIDTSLNRCHPPADDLWANRPQNSSFSIGEVVTYPVTIFRDGFGRDRPAQVGACSFSEMKDALWSAKSAGVDDFVIVSHNFEMLKPGSTEPDWTVVRRFASLCAFLERHADSFKVGPFDKPAHASASRQPQPSASFLSTAGRHAEQALRRVARRVDWRGVGAPA